MPKFKKFKDLSDRQQRRRLQIEEKIDNLYSIRQKINIFESIGPEPSTSQSLSQNQQQGVIEEPVIVKIPEPSNVEEMVISDLSDEQLVDVQDMPTAVTYNIQDQLRIWSCEYNVPASTTTALLKILRQHIKDLPTDARTLLRTPTSTITCNCGKGHYFHYGLEKALRMELKSGVNVDDIINININIDGLPLTKSSQCQLWPILGQINNSNSEPFLIGTYHGYTKPSDVQEFLRDFCAECLDKHNEGFYYNEKKYYVKLRAVICDTLARCLVACTKGHNARFGCSKCLCEGDYLRKMVFLQDDAPTRTNENFRNRINEEHRISISPFEQLPIDMVHTFPLDYMHLVCLGVMKILILLWMKEKRHTGYDLQVLRI